MAVANPLLPVVLLMVAMAVLLELQVTEFVRFCVLLSENVPVAVNCTVSPGAMVGFAGVTAIETNEAALTVSVRVALPVPPLFVALSVTVDVPVEVGFPEINPVPLFTVSPAGNPVAIGDSVAIARARLCDIAEHRRR